MASVDSIVAKMRLNPKGIRFADLCKVCDHYFVNRVKVAAVIGFIERRGKVIHASIFKIARGKPKPIRFAKR